MLRIALVDPDDATREPLRNLLLGVDSVWLEAECARYEYCLDVLRGCTADLIIVSLDADRDRALQLIGLLANEFPGIPVVAVSSDPQAILQALRAGARYFLTYPVVLEDLLTGLRQLAPRASDSAPAADVRPACRPSSSGTGAVRSSSAEFARRAKVIAVLGSRGGVGCTGLAVNLGCCLAQDPGNRVALVDLDLALGDADVALDLIPNHTLADVAVNIDRLDMDSLSRSLVKHEATGLSLLAHPLQVQDVGLIREDHVQRLLERLRAGHTHLVLDLSKGMTPTDLTALRIADEILLVGQVELTSLRNLVRLLLALGDEQGLSDKVKVVLNRIGADFREGEISQQKAEETIGKPIFWQVPEDADAMMGSRGAGMPLVQHAPGSRAHEALMGLAAAVCGTGFNPRGPARQEPAAAAPPRDEVECTVFAPPEVARGEALLVQVFAHTPEQAVAAAELAQEFDDQATRRGYKTLEMLIPRGSRLTFHLTMPGLQVDGPLQHLVWHGKPESVQFTVTVPAGRQPGTVIGTVTISQDTVPLGHIKFKLAVLAAREKHTAPGPTGESAQRYRKAFISYASEDRAEVLKRVQMLRQMGIGFFQDLLSLEPGSRWEQQLYRHIDDSDLFLLFWSSAAKNSRWVMEEVRYALKVKGGDEVAAPEIKPVVIEGPPPPPPPEELAHLHFNDYFTYFLTPVLKPGGESGAGGIRTRGEV